MTDITYQDLCKALAWAEGSMARGGADAAARYILATVEAPEPTLVSRLVPAPRVITTREELDALPEGSIIREHVDSEALQKDGNWYGADCGELDPEDVPLPATVLYTPEETK